MEKESTKVGSSEINPGQGSIREWFRDFLDLREGSDREGAVHSIVSGKLMRGSNAWMLVCSIMIASLGLNLNSGAVIIGAMLISPLMNPILGIGLGVGTNDRDMLYVALRNFGVAIAIALITSFIYFFFTPLSEFTPEMRARTEPTILDGLVAVFGGLAGIISVTRADKTSAIPGVAIATALMPPLCVAGYGIVEGLRGDYTFNIFWRAFYLFFLNSFFIAATAYLIIRLLRFPFRKYMNKRETRRSQIGIGVVSVLMIIPGYFILGDVLDRQRTNEAVESFTQRYFPTSMGSYIFDRSNPRRPQLIYPVIDHAVSSDSLKAYSRILQDTPYSVAGARVVIDTSFSPSEIANIKGELATLDGMNLRLGTIEESLTASALARQELTEELAEYRMDSAEFVNFSRQLTVAFPQINRIRVARAQATQPFGPDDEPRYEDNLPVVIYSEKRGAGTQVERLQSYLRLALDLDTVVLVREIRR